MTGLSPLALAHLEKREILKKKDKKEGRAKKLAAPLSTFLQWLKATLPATRRNSRSPFHELNSFHLELGLNCETRRGCGEIFV